MFGLKFQSNGPLPDRHICHRQIGKYRLDPTLWQARYIDPKIPLPRICKIRARSLSVYSCHMRAILANQTTFYILHVFSHWDRSLTNDQDLFILHALEWRHNGRDGVSNHQPHVCLLNRLFRRRSKKTSKLRVTGLLRGIHRGPVNSPHKWPVTREMFPFDDVIMWAMPWLPAPNLQRLSIHRCNGPFTYDV